MSGKMDLGSVADWVSGLASSAAVVLALWLALREQRRNRESHEAAQRTSAELHNLTIAKAADAAERVVTAFSNLPEVGPRSPFELEAAKSAALLREMLSGEIPDPTLRLGIAELQFLLDLRNNDIERRSWKDATVHRFYDALMAEVMGAVQALRGLAK